MGATRGWPIAFRDTTRSGVMAVLVMRVRIVGMRMRQHLVPVRVRVPRSRRYRLAVGVPVMRVVPVLVGVLQWLVRVPVLVPLGQV